MQQSLSEKPYIKVDDNVELLGGGEIDVEHLAVVGRRSGFKGRPPLIPLTRNQAGRRTVGVFGKLSGLRTGLVRAHLVKK